MVTLSISIFTIIIALLTALIVVFKRHKRFSDIALSLSLLLTAFVIFGDSMSMISPELVVEWKRIVFISEAVMVFLWLLFSLSFARTDYWSTVTNFSKFLIFLSPVFVVFFIMVPMDEFFYSPEFASEKILFLGNGGFIFNLLLLLYSIVAVINLEATLRSSSGTDKWLIKYTILGVGGILSISIFYYSHALLYRSINMNLLPVKTGVILISLFLIVYSLIKHKTQEVEIAVSRKVLYRSLSLIVVGVYLLGLGVIGEGMRYFGPTVGRNITTFLGFAGAILVLVIILSEQLRRKAIVFISKNFYSQKYDYREQWLLFTDRISLKYSLEELLSSIAEGFKEAIGVRGAAIWLKEKDIDEYVCVKVLDATIVDAKPLKELVGFLRDKKWVLNVHDSNCREIVSLNIEFIKSTRASLIVPLLNLDDLTGFVILREGIAEDFYNYEDYDLLKNLAGQATSAILNIKLSEELTEAKEMEAMGRLSSFIIHDLKNATSMLTLIAQNAEEHIDNPDVQKDAIKAISNSSGKINTIIEKLKNLPKKTRLALQDSDLGACVKTAVSELNIKGNTNLSFMEARRVEARFDREEITKVIINLIINALDATDYKGKIEILVDEEGDMGFVTVSDNGCGMSRKFIEKHLFKPFHTTKKNGLGIGLYQCKTIVEAHSGKLKVDSEEGRGTVFSMYLPKS
jgi:putative PEP-CTERM system histidine kinase